MFPSKDKTTICFAHVAYAMQDRFLLRNTGIKSFQVRNYEDFQKRVGEADVVVASGMWKNDVIPLATNLKFIQSISAGMDQYSKEQLASRGVRLCSASGVNARAVAEHAIALMLAISRRLPEVFLRKADLNAQEAKEREKELFKENGRLKMENEFDENIVIQKYLQAIDLALCSQ